MLSDRLALGVFRVLLGIRDRLLQEPLHDSASVLVDQARHALHTTTTSEATNGRLRDTREVVTNDLAVALARLLHLDQKMMKRKKALMGLFQMPNLSFVETKTWVWRQN